MAVCWPHFRHSVWDSQHSAYNFSRLQRLGHRMETDLTTRITALISLGFSLLSLLIAGTTAYFNTLKPPDISAAMSSPTWIWRSQLGMKFDCVLSNSGSSTGVVEDIVLVLDNADTHDRRKYVPVAIVDEEKFTTQMSAPDVSWVKSPFHPISIPGKGSVTIPILFLLSSPASEDPRPGHHKVTPYLRESNSDCWKQQ